MSPEATMPLHHIELNVTDLDRSFAFYSRFFSFLGESRHERGPSHFVFHLDHFYMWFNACDPARAQAGFDRYRIGLNHLAFATDSTQRVEEWHQNLLAHGVVVLDPPGKFGPEYFAVYFEDPDGMKLELGCAAP